MQCACARHKKMTAPGAVISGFRLTTLLGSGSFGVVFAATRVAGGGGSAAPAEVGHLEQVAIKVVALSRLSAPLRRALDAEIALQGALAACPAVARLHCVQGQLLWLAAAAAAMAAGGVT